MRGSPSLLQPDALIQMTVEVTVYRIVYVQVNLNMLIYLSIEFMNVKANLRNER